MPQRVTTPDELNRQMNRLLIDMGRSLLQYVGECWPWTGEEKAAERRAVAGLVRRQQRQIGRLVDFLSRRDWPIDFGSYPTEYTDLHYVALDYLLGQLIYNETELAREAELLLGEDWDEPAAVQLLGQIHAEQQSIAAELRKLAENHDPSHNHQPVSV